MSGDYARCAKHQWGASDPNAPCPYCRIATLEAELAEAKRTLDENDKIYLHASEVIADRNRLRDAIRRVLPRLVQTHSVYKSLRAALEGGDDG